MSRKICRMYVGSYTQQRLLPAISTSQDRPLHCLCCPKLGSNKLTCSAAHSTASWERESKATSRNHTQLNLCKKKCELIHTATCTLTQQSIEVLEQLDQTSTHTAIIPSAFYIMHHLFWMLLSTDSNALPLECRQELTKDEEGALVLSEDIWSGLWARRLKDYVLPLRTCSSCYVPSVGTVRTTKLM